MSIIRVDYGTIGGGTEVVPLTLSSDSSYYYAEASWNTNAKCVLLVWMLGNIKTVSLLDLVNGTALWTSSQTVVWQAATIAGCSLHYENFSAKGFKIGSITSQPIGDGIAIPLEEYPTGYTF